MDSKNIGVYKITNPEGKVYIGSSRNLSRRFEEYRWMNPKNKKQVRVWNSMKKYGVKSHTVEVIEFCDESELKEREGYYQDFYDSIHSGLNCVRVKTKDNPGYMSEETYQNILRANARMTELGRNVGESNGMYGKFGIDSPSSKIILDTSTGIFYHGLSEASEVLGITRRMLGARLTGRVKNKTSLRYC